MTTTLRLAMILGFIHLCACGGGGLSQPTNQPQTQAPTMETPTETPTQPGTTTPTTPVLTGQEERIVTIHDTPTPLTIVLDSSTVLCSAADYSASFLKVLIPQIASLTMFDHTNTGAGVPCIAAGACTATLNPEILVDASQPDANITLRVLLTRRYEIDHDAMTCSASLREELFTTIRGIDFYHVRNGEPANLDFATCLTAN